MSQVLSLIPELALIGIVDAGKPNEERIAIRPTQLASLQGAGLAVGLFDQETSGARPMFDNVFWFPDVVVCPPAWILVYTGPGMPRETTMDDGTKVFTYFWHRSQTIFGDPRLAVILFRLSGAVVGRQL